MKMTEFVTFHPNVKKFRVGKLPEGSKRVFVCVGDGGKGSEYIEMTPTEAKELARYLVLEAGRAGK